MMATPEIRTISADELQAMSRAELDAVLGDGQPIDIRSGDGRLRSRFGIANRTLRVEVSEIDTGEDGMLVAFAAGCRSIARQRSIGRIEWLVHAAACAPPNQRIRQVLSARGFGLQDVPPIGPVYRRLETLD